MLAELSDLNSANKLHHKEWPPGIGRAGVEHARDARMIHHGQRLPFRLETRDDRLRVHAELDYLEGHAPSHRLSLLGHENHAVAAFADLLEEFVTADAVAFVQ